MALDKRETQRLRKTLHDRSVQRTYQQLRALSGSMRFKIVLVLAEHGRGMNVTEIARVLQSSLSRISHQLRILREQGVVEANAHNRETVYTLVRRAASAIPLFAESARARA